MGTNICQFTWIFFCLVHPSTFSVRGTWQTLGNYFSFRCLGICCQTWLRWMRWVVQLQCLVNGYSFSSWWRKPWRCDYSAMPSQDGSWCRQSWLRLTKCTCFTSGFGKTSSIKFLSSKIQGSFFIKIGSPLWVAFRNCSHCVTWVRFSGNGNRNCSDECLWKQGCLARRLNKLETSTSGDQGTEKYFRCFKFCTDYERPGIHTVDGSEILHQLIW